jgi:hypothetical protein
MLAGFQIRCPRCHGLPLEIFVGSFAIDVLADCFVDDPLRRPPAGFGESLHPVLEFVIELD